MVASLEPISEVIPMIVVAAPLFLAAMLLTLYVRIRFGARR